MKQIFLMITLLIGSLFACAQAKDTALAEYTGKYTFPEGSYVTSAEISLNGSELMVTSSEGNSALEKRGKDSFSLVSFGGMVYFYRNTAGKVARIKVEVSDILLEGTKEGVSTAWLNRKMLFNDPKQKQAR